MRFRIGKIAIKVIHLKEIACQGDILKKSKKKLREKIMAKNKSDRLSVMKKIIENKNVLTQEELKEELEHLGYYVSQPTLSRDIKEIGGIREKHSKKYRFTLDEQNKINKERLEKIISETTVSMNVPLHAIWFRISSCGDICKLFRKVFAS